MILRSEILVIAPLFSVFFLSKSLDVMCGGLNKAFRFREKEKTDI